MLARLKRWVVEKVLVVPALRLGSHRLPSDAQPVLWADDQDPTETLPAGSVLLQVNAGSPAEVIAVRHGSGYSRPVKVAADAASAAAAAAAAAQSAHDALQTAYDALAALLGDVGSVVGPEAPEGYPATLTAGFVAIISDLSEKLTASRVRGLGDDLSRRRDPDRRRGAARGCRLLLPRRRRLAGAARRRSVLGCLRGRGTTGGTPAVGGVDGEEDRWP